MLFLMFQFQDGNMTTGYGANFRRLAARRPKLAEVMEKHGVIDDFELEFSQYVLSHNGQEPPSPGQLAENILSRKGVRVGPGYTI
jgi:hypothetical protein